jgi:hypothetical protein
MALLEIARFTMKLRMAIRSCTGNFEYLSRGVEIIERRRGEGVGSREDGLLELDGDGSRGSGTSFGSGAKSNLVRISRMRGKFSLVAC